jgi:hypothetical protein
MIDFSGARISPGDASFFEKLPYFFIEIGAIIPATKPYRRQERHSFGVKTGLIPMSNQKTIFLSF